MIQLATDPNASRLNWRPAAAKGETQVRGPRNGHAWPFISRQAERPAVPKDPKRTPGIGS